MKIHNTKLPIEKIKGKRHGLASKQNILEAEALPNQSIYYFQTKWRVTTRNSYLEYLSIEWPQKITKKVTVQVWITTSAKTNNV